MRGWAGRQTREAHSGGGLAEGRGGGGSALVGHRRRRGALLQRRRRLLQQPTALGKACVARLLVLRPLLQQGRAAAVGGLQRQLRLAQGRLQVAALLRRARHARRQRAHLLPQRGQLLLSAQQRRLRLGELLPLHARAGKLLLGALPRRLRPAELVHLRAAHPLELEQLARVLLPYLALPPHQLVLLVRRLELARALRVLPRLPVELLLLREARRLRAQLALARLGLEDVRALPVLELLELGKHALPVLVAARLEGALLGAQPLGLLSLACLVLGEQRGVPPLLLRDHAVHLARVRVRVRAGVKVRARAGARARGGGGGACQPRPRLVPGSWRQPT